MCRSIKPLFNFDPPATDDEIHEASLQFVRKVSGSQKPSAVNEKVFSKAISEIEPVVRSLLHNLTTSAQPKNREVEKQKAHQKALRRFGKTD